MSIHSSSCPRRRASRIQRIYLQCILDSRFRGNDDFSKLRLSLFRRITWVIFLFCLVLAVPSSSWAMHISDGVLSAPWAGFWFLAAAPFVAWGLRELKTRSGREPFFKPLLGLIGAGVFIISCLPIPVPIIGTCSHMCGTGLAAILIGPALTTVVTSIVLTLQALFLADGGLTAWGADVFSMGVTGAFTGYGVFRLARRLGLPWFAAAFLAGLLSDWATYSMTAFQLAGALASAGSRPAFFWGVLLGFLPTQLPLGIFEGLISAGAYRFVRQRRPEFLALIVREPRREAADA